MMTDMNTALGNFIIVTGAFLTLLVLLRLFAWKNIAGIFEQRATTIANEIDETTRLKDEAATLVRERRLQLDEVQQQATQILQEAKTTGEATQARLLAAAEQEAQAIKTRAEQAAQQTQTQAYANLKAEVTDLSLQIAQAIMMQELTPETHHDLIERYLDKLGDASDGTNP